MSENQVGEVSNAASKDTMASDVEGNIRVSRSKVSGLCDNGSSG